MFNNAILMAWNEPGGGSGKRPNPWGGGNGSGNEGPPDLDQIFKKLNDKLRNMFGGNGSGIGGGSGMPSLPSGNGTGIGIGFILAIIAIAYVVLGFYIVKPAEQAVITRFGKYERTVGPGPHWYPRFIEKKHVVNTEEITSTRHSGTMLTKDENLVTVEIQVQYRVNDINNYLFKVAEPERSLQQAAESALRQSIGNNKLDFIITDGRAEIEEQACDQIRYALDSYNAGLYVTTVTLKEAKAPDQVKAAFDDAIKAREDRERFLHEAEAYYNKIVPEARGDAQRMLQEAEGYKQETINLAIGDAQRFELALPEYNKAPQITKTRLYLNALTQVLENSSKVVVDLEKGNNLIYLPIDKLMGISENTKSQRIEDLVNFEPNKLANNNEQQTTIRPRDRMGRD